MVTKVTPRRGSVTTCLDLPTIEGCGGEEVAPDDCNAMAATSSTRRTLRGAVVGATRGAARQTPGVAVASIVW